MKKTLLIGLGLLSSIGHIQAMQEAAPHHWTAQQAQNSESRQETWYDDRIREDRGAIYFYERGLPYYEFTNFFEHTPPLVIDTFTWPTVEQFYQAGKFTDNELRHIIRTGMNFQGNLLKPNNQSWGSWAFSQARAFKPHQRNDWFTYIPQFYMQRNINRMLVGLRAKFNQDANLKRMLLETYPKVLVEDSPRDGYFGIGDPDRNIPQGAGENLLGRLLMHVRRELFTRRERPFDQGTDFSLAYLLGPGAI